MITRLGGLLAAGLLLCQGCSAQDKNARTGVTARPAAESAEDKTVLAVSKAIRQYRLVNKPDECLAYQFDGKSLKDAYVVEVRENHRRPQCGGDPRTAPRLFTVHVSRKTGEITTDANSASGEFHRMSQ